MIDNTPIRDEKCGPPFMHTALMTALELNYIKIVQNLFLFANTQVKILVISDNWLQNY